MKVLTANELMQVHGGISDETYSFIYERITLASAFFGTGFAIFWAANTPYTTPVAFVLRTCSAAILGAAFTYANAYMYVMSAVLMQEFGLVSADALEEHFLGS